MGNGGSCNGITQDCAKQTATEIYELHSSWTPQWSNLVAYWKMNEVASAGIVEDSVGSNDGIPFNVNQGNPGVLKHSGNFNGVSSYITTGNTATLELGNSLSVSAWINPTSSVKTGAYNPRILLKMDDANNGYMLSLGNSDFSKPLAVHFDLKKAGTQYAPTTSAIISTGVWTHVFCTWDGVTANIYLNGVLETSISETNEFTYGNVSDLILGARLKSGSGMFKGSMDEIAIWNTALTSTEINILYERQKNNYSGTFTSRILSAENNSRWTNLNWVPTLAFYKELPDYASGANQYEIISGPNGYPSLNDNNLPNNLMRCLEQVELAVLKIILEKKIMGLL